MGIREEKKATTTCRNCGWWDRRQAMDAAGRIRRDRAARCRWESTEPYPVSVIPSDFGIHSRPKGGYTVADNGSTCPCFKPAEIGP